MNNQSTKIAKTFYAFMMTLRSMDTPVGDLAHEMKQLDDAYPASAVNKSTHRRYVSQRYPEHFVAVFDEAWDLWLAYKASHLDLYTGETLEESDAMIRGIEIPLSMRYGAWKISTRPYPRRYPPRYCTACREGYRAQVSSVFMFSSASLYADLVDSGIYNYQPGQVLDMDEYLDPDFYDDEDRAAVLKDLEERSQLLDQGKMPWHFSPNELHWIEDWKCPKCHQEHRIDTTDRAIQGILSETGLWYTPFELVKDLDELRSFGYPSNYYFPYIATKREFESFITQPLKGEQS
jgi:uncharacterized protein YozE (UPF0346 family)